MVQLTQRLVQCYDLQVVHVTLVLNAMCGVTLALQMISEHVHAFKFNNAIISEFRWATVFAV